MADTQRLGAQGSTSAQSPSAPLLEASHVTGALDLGPVRLHMQAVNDLSFCLRELHDERTDYQTTLRRAARAADTLRVLATLEEAQPAD